jgi:hypothetical protein
MRVVMIWLTSARHPFMIGRDDGTLQGHPEALDRNGEFHVHWTCGTQFSRTTASRNPAFTIL